MPSGERGFPSANTLSDAEWGNAFPSANTLSDVEWGNVFHSATVLKHSLLYYVILGKYKKAIF